MMYVKNRLFKSEILKNHKCTLQNTSSSKMPFECQTIHDQFLHYCWVLESVQSRNASRWPHCRRCLGPWVLQRTAARHHSHLQTLVRRSVFQRFALAKKWMDSPSNQQKVFFGRFWQGVHNFDEYVYKYIYIPVNIYIYTCKYIIMYIPLNFYVYIIYLCVCVLDSSFNFQWSSYPLKMHVPDDSQNRINTLSTPCRTIDFCGKSVGEKWLAAPTSN